MDSRTKQCLCAARFLVSLGLQQIPSVKDILSLAAHPTDTNRRTKALNYFLSHYSDYASSYNPSEHDLRFVPAKKGDLNTLMAPKEVFADPGCSVLGFAVLQATYKDEASKFKLLAHPPSSEIIDALVLRPPDDIPKASAVFSYLSSRVSGSICSVCFFSLI
jgi:hypothetical protein